MKKMRSFRFPEEKLELLKEIAERRHDNNQTQALIEAIDHYYQELNPLSVQGYIRIDRIHDLNGDEDCPGCEQSLGSGAWVAVYSDGTVKGVLCDDCVEADGA
jgi:predicted DNA-binding protein